MVGEEKGDPRRAFDRDHRALAFERARIWTGFGDEGSRLLWSGLFSLRLHRFEEAVDFASRALGRLDNPKSRAFGLGLRADSYSELWRLDEAESDMREALRLMPERRDQFHDLGKILLQAERFHEAEGAFREAAGSPRPEIAATGLLSLGRLFRTLRRYDEARECVARARDLRALDEEGEGLAADLDEVLGMVPELSRDRDLVEWEDLASSLSRQGSGPSALAEVRERSTRDESCPLFVFGSLAGDLYEIGRYRDVIALLDRAPREGSPMARQVLLVRAGKAAARVGETDLAFRLMERALLADPTSVWTLTCYGAALLGCGRLVRAEEVLRRGATEVPEPEQDELYFNLGQTLRSLRRYREALECYEIALELDPDYEWVHTPKKDVERVLDEFGAAV